MANTLNYSINNKEVSFSTKSLTIDGSEYLYKDITAIKHSSAKCLYLFKVDGKWHELFYDEAHKKGVSTIFKKVADHLTAVKKAKAAAEAAVEPKPVPEETAAEAPAVEEPASEPEAEEAPVEEEAPSLIEALAETEGISTEPEAEPEPVAEEAPAEEAAPEEESAEEEVPAKEEAPTEGEEPSEEEKAAEEEEESKAEEPDKKSKKKKAFIVFAIIIALFIIAGIIYFFTIGLPSESLPADGQDTTHQYNDIDELIDEMQK